MLRVVAPAGDDRNASDRKVTRVKRRGAAHVGAVDA
jgi:hypothetical protein